MTNRSPSYWKRTKASSSPFAVSPSVKQHSNFFSDGIIKQLTTLLNKSTFKKSLFEIDFPKIVGKTCYIMYFKFNGRFLKQVEYCTMGGPLSFSAIYKIKMESNIVKASKSIF